MKALIKVGYGCNDHCSFCHTLDVRHVDAEAEEVHRKIDRAKALGHTMVVLSGGEPTIRPELVRWAEHVAALDMDFGLVTNGRMLSYPALVEKLMERRLRYVYLSLHGGTAKIHDLMVRSDAFEQTYGALRVLAGRGLDLTANCVITRHNVEHLRELVGAVSPYPDATLKYSMVEPKGGGAKLFEHLMPRVTEVAARVKDAIDYARERAPGLRVRHGAIPLCLMQGYEAYFDDLKTHRFATMIEVGEPDFYPVDDLNKIQPQEKCRGCSLAGPCPGLYRGYHEVFGDSELAPVRDRARSNSFNFKFEALVTAEAPEGSCPLREGGVSPWDQGRHLFVKNGPRIARFRADTRDFSDEEVRAIKHDLGQVYLDVSRGKDAPDDFASDLRPLRRSALCASCGERARCTGMFEPALDDDVFTRDDARVRELVAGLEGDVADLGCGEGRYDDVLDRVLARLGPALRYHAIDPDAAAIERLRARRPWALASVRTAEEWAREAAPSSLDRILLLRSWNHLRDPARVAAAIARALRPGGEVVICDDVPFGLARTRAQASRAEGSRAAFEHLRVDDSRDCLRVLEPAGLEPIEHRPVEPGGSCQWLVRARRTG